MVHFGDWIFSHVLDAASVITSMILIPFIVFFLIKDGRDFKKSFVSIMPNRYFEFTLYLFYKLNSQVGNYLRGQMIDALIVGILSTAAMWLIGVKYFILVGTFAGLANVVPYFGPIAGAVLAVILSVLQTGSFHLSLYVLIAFAIIKLIDDAVIQPVVVAKSVHMHPLTVLLSVLAGGKLFGILGMLLSVPVVGFLKVIALESLRNYRRYREV
jgi:predicted PurR-regulated permease PerM